MAKVSGLSRRSLRKTDLAQVSLGNSRWKDWIGELYEKRFGQKTGTNDNTQAGQD